MVEAFRKEALSFVTTRPILLRGRLRGDECEFFLSATVEAIPSLAAWLAVPLLLLGAALAGWMLERREEHRVTSGEGA